MNKDFSIQEAIRTGWKLFKANAVFLIALFVAMAMVQGILYLRPHGANSCRTYDAGLRYCFGDHISRVHTYYARRR